MSRALAATYRILLRAHAETSGRRCQRKAAIEAAERRLAQLKPPAAIPRIQRKGAWRWTW